MKVKNKGQQSGARLRQVEQKLGVLTEQTNNLNSHALETIRKDRQMEQTLEMLCTCVTILIKDCIGRGVSAEEAAALAELIDGPAKKEGDSGELATESVEGTAAQPASGDVPGE